MMSQTGVQLPVAFNQVDGSCMNQNLPNGNDKWPSVQFLPGADTQLGGYAIALFRLTAQSRATKSPIHCFCYNLLQQYAFNNQFWQQWCQYVVDFADFLNRGQGQPPQVAADKAAARIYQVMLATVINQYPALRQVMEQNVLIALNDAAALATNINNDINAWKQRVLSGGGMGGAMPGMGGMMQPQQTNVNAFTVSGVAQPSGGYNNPAATGPASTGGLLLSGGSEPSKPTSSWNGGAAPAAQPQGLAQAANKPATPPANTAAKSDIIDHDHKAPASVADIKIDPRFYVPKGHVIDPARPYDHIRNPGGVEIRPAHQVKWKRTVGSDAPYGAVINPNTHMLFLAKWVDGVVKEVVVQLEPEMDYLKHELSEALRSKAMRPKGIVVPLPKYSQSEDLSVKTIEVTKQALDDNLVKPEFLSPVALDGYLTGTTDLENEAMARATVVELLGLGEDDPVPPHEYITARMNELSISDACAAELTKFEQFTKPAEVVEGLKKLVESGMLPLRYFNFINQRLTQSVNDFLRDSLSIEKLKISNYLEDAVELGTYLRNKRGPEYEEVYTGNTQSIVGRSMTVGTETMAVEEGQDPESAQKNYGIIDEYLNFQLGLPSDELSNLNLTEEACLVSPQSHPNLIAALRAMATRAQEMGTIKRVRMRLITSDGFYYEVIVGKLVKGALLLKKV